MKGVAVVRKKREPKPQSAAAAQAPPKAPSGKPPRSNSALVAGTKAAGDRLASAFSSAKPRAVSATAASASASPHKQADEAAGTTLDDFCLVQWLLPGAVAPAPLWMTIALCSGSCTCHSAKRPARLAS